MNLLEEPFVREERVPLRVGTVEIQDLTERARNEGFQRLWTRADLRYAKALDSLGRILHRRHGNSILLTGQPGVGKTSAVWDLARRAAGGEIPFLQSKRFFAVDCRQAPVGAGKELLAILFSALKDQNDVILCLDGIASLLRSESGGDYKLHLRSAMSASPIQLIGILSDHDYDELVAGDREMLELFTRVRVEEPDEVVALQILGHSCKGLAEDYGLQIDEAAIRRTVLLASSYIMNERLPAKAIKILERACEDLHYERKQLGSARTTVTAEDVVRVVAEISGVPESTLTGIGDMVNFEQSLGNLIFGQPEAVRVVATELDLIRAGLVDPSKPASVMLFAGQTGTGKTELAKTIAKLYSSSKRLHTYSMGNFTEPHSVSGIIGVPPGYVGHDAGGRLINELNSDPYSVILLDEIEKAHPEVLKPLLHLLDEGWIIDQRGMRAYADRAIVIMTSNVGENMISELVKAGESPDAVMERMKAAFAGIRHPRTNLPVFNAAFLPRIKRTVIFRPLDKAAMLGICQRLLVELQLAWRQRREKSIEVSEPLVAWIGQKAHELNERSAGKEGGRVVRKIISDLIEANVQRYTAIRPDTYRSADRITLHLATEQRAGQDDPTGVVINDQWGGPAIRVEARGRG